MLKDILVQAAFANAIDRLTKAAKKNGMDNEETSAVFHAVLTKHYPIKGISTPAAK